MTLFEKILIATDGSEKNKNAVDEAIKIGRACGSTLYAVYVIDTSIYEADPADASFEKVYQQLGKEGEEAVRRVRDLATDLAVETFVIGGRPAREITRFASENKVDLLIVGTQGRSGIERLFLGSVADKVIRTAGCPVLVIRSI